MPRGIYAVAVPNADGSTTYLYVSAAEMFGWMLFHAYLEKFGKPVRLGLDPLEVTTYICVPTPND